MSVPGTVTKPVMYCPDKRFHCRLSKYFAKVLYDQRVYQREDSFNDGGPIGLCASPTAGAGDLFLIKLYLEGSTTLGAYLLYIDKHADIRNI